MCFLNASNSVIHALNNACDSTADLKKLGDLEHPVTSVIYIVTAALCIVLGLFTHFRYNSVTVLNLTVRTKTISNIPWISYFTVLGCRTLTAGVIYGVTNDSPPKGRLQGFFITDAVLKSLEVLFLVWALNHQRKYRSGGFIQQEISSFNSGGQRMGDQDIISLMTKMVTKLETFLATLFILSIIFLTVQEILQDDGREPFNWIYLGFVWTLCIVGICLLLVIIRSRNEDGPQLCVKVLFVIGVLLTLPGDIPSYVWSSCVKCTCHTFKDIFTCHDLAIFLSIPSAIIFFIALRLEFLRLDQEAQYSAVGEVESLFSVHTTHTESL